MKVSVPYEITLLSNTEKNKLCASLVSVPYEITLLSNIVLHNNSICIVSVPYEITLLSNNSGVESRLDEFQYLMKLHYSQTKVVPLIV